MAFRPKIGCFRFYMPQFTQSNANGIEDLGWQRLPKNSNSGLILLICKFKCYIIAGMNNFTQKPAEDLA